MQCATGAVTGGGGAIATVCGRYQRTPGLNWRHTRTHTRTQSAYSRDVQCWASCGRATGPVSSCGVRESSTLSPGERRFLTAILRRVRSRRRAKLAVPWDVHYAVPGVLPGAGKGILGVRRAQCTTGYAQVYPDATKHGQVRLGTARIQPSTPAYVWLRPSCGVLQTDSLSLGPAKASSGAMYHVVRDLASFIQRAVGSLLKKKSTVRLGLTPHNLAPTHVSTGEFSTS